MKDDIRQLIGKVVEVAVKGFVDKNTTIVGKLKDVNEDGIVIEKPLQFRMFIIPNQATGMIQMTTMFLPFMNTTNPDEITIRKGEFYYVNECESTTTLVGNQKISVAQLYEQKVKELEALFSGIELPNQPQPPQSNDQIRKAIEESLKINKEKEN